MIRMSSLSAAIFSITLAATAAGQIPAEARKLAETREKEIHRINLAYLQRLDALLTRYKSAGDEAAAEAIAGMIREVERPPAPSKPAAAGEDPALDALIGKWRRDYDKAIIEFKDAKSGVYAGETPFTISYNPDTKLVTLTSAKWVDTVAFTLHEDILKGGHNNKIPYKLTRIK